MGKHYAIEGRRNGSKHWHDQSWIISNKRYAARQRNEYEENNPGYEFHIVRVTTTETREIVK